MEKATCAQSVMPASNLQANALDMLRKCINYAQKFVLSAISGLFL